MAHLFGRKREGPARTERVHLGNGAQESQVDADERSRTILYVSLTLVAFLVVLELLFPGAIPESGIELQVGQVATEELVAPFDFDVLKSEDALETERAQREASVVPVYRFRRDIQADHRQILGDLVTRIYGIREGDESDRQKLEMLGQLGYAISDTTREILLDQGRSREVEERARVVLFLLYERGILPTRGHPPLKDDETVVLLKDDEESMERVGAFHREENLPNLIAAEASKTFDDPAMSKAVGELVAPFLVGNVVHDFEVTEKRKEDARGAVSELTGVDVKKDEVILERGERITKDHVNVVRSMNEKRADLLMMEEGHKRFFPVLGRALSAALLLGILSLYAAVRRKKFLFTLRPGLLFLVVVIVVMIGAAVVRGVPDASEFLVPVAVLAMLFSMLLGFEIAVASLFIVSILVSLYTGFGLPFVIVSLVAGTVAAFSVRRVRNREDFYWSGIRVVAAYAIAILVVDIARLEFGVGTLTRVGWGGLNAIVSMGVVVVTLPLFERGFRVTTDITLLELADMNKPLLRKMAMTAPGSYHHSIVVGNLAEAAAEAIKANGLLARVGAYYHDIGKLVGPGYFVENQQGLDPEDSKHTAIKPKMSSMVLRAHVKDGEELARKEGLPEPIIDVIREHHGTSVMEFFYNKALEESEDPGEVSKANYSYPGPRPRSKESAIIALADTIEARVRSSAETATPKRIESEIDAVMERRRRDHQLDDAALTLADLRKIREAFFRVLVSMYHQRIKYPDQDENGEAEGALGEAANGDQDRRQTEEN